MCTIRLHAPHRLSRSFGPGVGRSRCSVADRRQGDFPEASSLLGFDMSGCWEASHNPAPTSAFGMVSHSPGLYMDCSVQSSWRVSLHTCELGRSSPHGLTHRRIRGRAPWAPSVIFLLSPWLNYRRLSCPSSCLGFWPGGARCLGHLCPTSGSISMGLGCLNQCERSTVDGPLEHGVGARCDHLLCGAYACVCVRRCCDSGFGPMIEAVRPHLLFSDMQASPGYSGCQYRSS